MSNVTYGVIGLAVICVVLWAIFTFFGFGYAIAFIAFLAGVYSVARPK